MSLPGDDMSEMRSYRQVDDATAEALLRGDVVAPEIEPVSEFVRNTRAMASAGAVPSRELAQRIATGDFTGIHPAAVPTSKPGKVNRRGFTSMGARARIATGVAVMLTGFTGVTMAGALPDGAQRTVDSIIETVFPFTVGGPAQPSEVADDAGTTESPDAHAPAVDPEPYSGSGRAGREDDSGRSSSGAAGTDRPGRKPTEHPGGGNSSGAYQTGGKPGNRPAVSGQ